MTKLSVREDAENGVSAEKLREINKGIVDKLNELPGYLSGGNFVVEEGDSYTGSLRFEPEVGKQVFLDGSVWFHSSVVREITKESEKSYIIKTANSIYRLEEL